jgi:hypothetical protein
MIKRKGTIDVPARTTNFNLHGSVNRRLTEEP